MTLSLSLSGFGADNPVPGTYAEVRFAQGASAGDLGTARVLILAPKTSDGTITANTQVAGPFSDEADFITYAGIGSPAHRMAREFLRLCKSANVYLLCPAAASGSATVDKITVSGTASKSCSLSLTIAGEDMEVSIVSNDTATAIGDSIATAINARPWLPVTASNTSGTVTVTAKIVGSEMNSIRFRCRLNGTGTGLTVSPVADTALGTSGASGAAASSDTISLTSALATISNRNFDYILSHVQEATPIDALCDQVDLQAEATTGFRQRPVFGSSLTPAAATTLAAGSSLNRARASLVNIEESPEEHYVLCAKVAAVFVKEETVDPSFNFDGYGTKPGQTLPVKVPFNGTAYPLAAEIKLMLNSGVTAIGYTDAGQPYIVRAVTTYCKNGDAFDYRARDRHIVTVTDRWTRDMVAKLRGSPWTKITLDPVGSGKEPGAEFATPRRVKASVEQLVSDYCDRGWLDPARKQDILDGMQVGSDPLVPSRMNISVPLYSAIMLHQHALLVRESSAAA